MMDDKIISNVTGQAHKFASKLGLSEQDSEDLVQEALLSVWASAEKFEGGSAFSTFAYAVAARHMKNWAESRQNSVIPVPRRVGEALRSAAIAKMILTQELGREPRNREIAESMGITLDDYELMRTKGEYDQSDSDMGSGDPMTDTDHVSFEDSVEDTGINPRPEESVTALEFSTVLRDTVATMTSEEQQCVSLLFGLDEENPDGLSLRQVGEHLGISHELVRRHRDRALAKLRARLPAEYADMELPVAARVTA